MKKPGFGADSASSDRPISNLTFLFKLIEHLVCRQLTTYEQQNHLVTPLQSAYRMHSSTETAILKIASDIFDAMNDRYVALLALLDFDTAFGTVDHYILIHRLNNSYGIGGTALRWIRSLLSGLVQFVCYVGQQSSQSFLTCSIPQGSVPGPFFFSLYATDVVYIA